MSESLLDFDHVHIDGPIESDHDLFLRVCADRELTVDGRRLWREIDVPIVELANQLLRWLSNELARGKDFSYDSLESVVQGLIWFRREEDAWRVGSVNQVEGQPGETRQARRLLTTNELREQVTNFVDRVIKRTRSETGRDVSGLVRSEEFWHVDRHVR